MFASLGTIPDPVNVPVFRKIAEACAGVDAQLVLALGSWLEEHESLRSQLGTLPGNPLVVDFAPQLALLDKAALLITHAGVNTVLEAITRGVPMVALPRSVDQPGMAARIEHAGIGFRVSFNRCTPGEVRSAIERVLGDDRFRCRVKGLQQAMIAAGGAPVRGGSPSRPSPRAGRCNGIDCAGTGDEIVNCPENSNIDPCLDAGKPPSAGGLPSGLGG